MSSDPRPPKIPESVLVVIHTPQLDVLLIERADAPGVTHNTEHVFALEVPAGTRVTLAPREHTALQWLPWRAAADACFSPSNAEAILHLPRWLNERGRK